MTSSVDAQSVRAFGEINTIKEPLDPHGGKYKKKHRRHVLKAKENSSKHKCQKLLNRKLKKYKLRRDGYEDQDVLDVSNILVSSLVIKSPNSLKDPSIEEGDLNYIEDLRPKNYLFKMVRRKLAHKINGSGNSPNVKQKSIVELSEPINNPDKKHTNAFKLLMESRNKSIGSNSPGKDKCHDQPDSEEVKERKITKAKRNLLLQKMAEVKGYLKNKEIEECQDKIIKRKMDKRAERLKNMIVKNKKSVDSGNNLVKSDDSPNLNKSHKTVVKVINNYETKKQQKSFKIVDIFNTLNDPVIVSPEKKNIPKEDKDFLNKLSPSLKKKESMLSYFKKVDKEPESVPVDLDNDTVIKVKLQLKKKTRKKKLSHKRDAINLDDQPETNDENNVITTNTKPSESAPACVNTLKEKPTVERQKRKRNIKLEEIHSSDSNVLTTNNDCRPKRSIKRPIKYNDDVCVTSSDEELHIFTPKKKKHAANTAKDTAKANIRPKQIVSEPINTKAEKKIIKDTNTPKKPVKLAPIFASKQLDAAALEAKQKFLHSGVPDKLKKQIQQQTNDKARSIDFPIVVHVQQKDLVFENKSALIKVFEENSYDISPLECGKDSFKELLNLDKPLHIDNAATSNCKINVQTTILCLKQSHPKFPVYRTYRYLKGKGMGENKDYSLDLNNSSEIMSDIVDVPNDSPDKWNWTDKYKANSTNQIIGNFESIKEMRKWLVSWTENAMKAKAKGNNGSDSSDYYMSDTDSRDSFKSMNNLLILTGPSGCGKTSSVYAVAAELSMKVIEVNASSKRTGKIMLQDLQEATQSHKVNRGTSTDNSQKLVEKSLTEQLKKNKKRGRPKKSIESIKKSSEKAEMLSSTPSSQESTRTGMSLILIDDADIVFDQDDGFASAIVQLVQCSKRPVILITSSLVCSHLQRFVQHGKILKMCPLLPRLLGTWLDIMCLADSGISWPGVGAKFLNYFKGDIRKTINYLQFYISIYAKGLNSDEETSSQNIECYKANIDDENSSMSWADHDDLDGRNFTPVLKDNEAEMTTMWTNFVKHHSDFKKFVYPIQLFEIWWSIPHLLNTVPNVTNPMTKETVKSQNNKETVKELEAIADAIDAISLSDYSTRLYTKSTSNVTAQPWYCLEYDSVSEQDNLDYYMNKYEVGDEICHTLVAGCIAVAQDTLNCDRKADICFPGMSMQRERDKIVSRHKNLTSYLSPWSILDRRSLATDYWSSCRTICRIEKIKSDANISTKRNNRFCHYLKSLSILCKSETFDNLCDSLSNETTLNINDFD